ncbi:MAG: HlyD family efflux transporter periplasmic adaptor subunit [Gammaproteobacteria bacterium]|nr:HlyD family efflux transporter periplasmic adaptor subunit [Gammaproteobacteria bacterium]MDH5302684.1 HlyD family efflux transporter periplasmic adaptor subunit [Gammaproteobacteria bacterium]MDH5320879.1 HlyD family efflux transporter periplasmic adaptor subunit [Gammaproteobacteria bacterium]
MNIRIALILTHLVLFLAACDPDAKTRRFVGQLASDRVELSVETSEPIIEILVAEGESVAAGQLLFRQDARRATARLAEAEATVRQLQARLDELTRGPRSEQIAAARANVAGALKELEFRESEYARVQEIYARELASPDLLDRTRAALDAAAANHALRRAQLEELLNGTTVEELAQAEQAVMQAAARRQQLAVDLERLDAHAPLAGLVDSRLFEVGERPAPGQPVMVLLPATQPYAQVYVAEEARVHVRAGDTATVFVDGLQQGLNGRVRWVASEAMFTPYFALTERDRHHLSYEAKVELEFDGQRLPDGVPVEVELHD